MCSDVNEVADGLLEQTTSDVIKINAGVDKCVEMLAKIEKEEQHFVGQVARAKAEINENVKQTKQAIEAQKEKLMNELSSMKEERMKEIQSLREEIERRKLSMETYHKEVNELRQRGTASDIARAARCLQDEAEQLLKIEDFERMTADLGHTDVTFTSPKNVIDDVNKVLRQLRLSTIKTG